MTTITLRRVEAGVYETLDGQHRIIQTDGWGGPRGGSLRFWEHATLDRFGWTVHGDVFERTLREARAQLAAASSRKQRRS